MYSSEFTVRQIEFVRALKGAPASILLAFIVTGGELNMNDLKTITGYSDKPLTRAIRFLALKGLVQKYRDRRWILSPKIKAEFHKAAFVSASQDNRGPAPDTIVTRSPAAQEERKEPGPVDDRPLSGTRSEARFSAKSRRIYRASPVQPNTRENFSSQQRIFSESTRTIEHNRTFDVVGGSNNVHDPLPHQQHEPINRQNISELEQILRFMGIQGRAKSRLLARPDLQAQPAIVQAWWMYYQGRAGINNPAGVTICRLEEGDDPPGGYLTLAKCWPTISRTDRQEMMELRTRNWTAQELARRFGEKYPEMTDDAFTALLSVFMQTLEEASLSLPLPGPESFR